MAELVPLLHFGGYVALLLWGVHMVQSGVQRAFGAALRLRMGQALGTRPRAFFTGLAITAAIQSSTATGLMITSFAAGGFVALAPGLAAMLGANVGTTLIVQLLSFNITALAPTSILIGVWMFRRSTPGRWRDFGRVFIGLGLLLLALEALVALFSPLEDAAILGLLLQALDGYPLLAMLFAAALAWASHSSVAVVVLVMSLASHQDVSTQLACVLVLGANIGTAINPMLESMGDDNPASRRLPLGNLGTRIVGSVIALTLMPFIPGLMELTSQNPGHAVANFHTAFNVCVALLFLPLLSPYAQLIKRLLPQRTDPNDPARPRYLDDAAHEVPAIALGNAAREALRVSDLNLSLLASVRAGFLRENRRRQAHARYLNNALDSLVDKITVYLATLDDESMNKNDHRRRDEILTFVMNLSQAADIAAGSLMSQMASARKQGLAFSETQRDELDAIMERLMRNQRQSAALFVSEDLKSARFLAFEKDYFRDLESSASELHLDDIKNGRLEAAEAGSLYLDIVRDAKQVNSHLVGATAYPILARHNELLPNRLRPVEDERA